MSVMPTWAAPVVYRRDTAPRCEASEAIDLDPEIWGDDAYDHQCCLDPGHDTTHRCRYCSHTWEDE